MYLIKSKNRKDGINIPTNLKEFTPAILKHLTEGIIVHPHYSIVMLARKMSLFDIATITNKKNQSADITVIPIIAKTNNVDDNMVIEVGTIPIITSNDIEFGTHLRIPTIISAGYVIKYVDSDKDLRMEFMNKTYKGNYELTNKHSVLDVITEEEIKQRIIADNNTDVFVVEFKMVPNNSFKGSYPINHKIIDPFEYKQGISDVSN